MYKIKNYYLSIFVLFALLSISLLYLCKHTYALSPNEILISTNEYRSQMNKDKLNLNNNLVNAAQKKAEDMSQMHYFGDISPDGVTAWNYITNSGYIYAIAGEDIALTNKHTTDILNAWKTSSPHKDNLLNNNFSDVGIGIAKIDGIKSYKNASVVVMFFGRSANVQLANATTSPAGAINVLKPNIDIYLSKLAVALIIVIITTFALFIYTKYIKKRNHKI